MSFASSAASFPFFRFSLRYCMSPNEVNGPRISYLQSVYFIEQGEGTFLYEDKIYNLTPGIQIYIPSGKKHKWVSSGTKPIVFLCVFFEWNYAYRPNIKYRNDYLAELGTPIIESFIDKIPEINISEYIVLNSTGEWIRLYNNITSNIDVYDTKHFPSSIGIQGQFHLFLDYIIKQSVNTKTFVDKRIYRIIEKMKNPNTDFPKQNVEELANSMGLSRSHFHYLFKMYTGTTPNKYWNEQRINSTLTDLIHLNISITEIAAKYNFESVHYYSKLFHKVMGITPSQFRSRFKLY